MRLDEKGLNTMWKMNRRQALSPKFNLSLALLPGVIVVIACLVIKRGTWLPLWVEGSVFFVALLLLLFGRKWAGLLDKRRHRLIQVLEAAIVSARILFILVAAHAIVALLAWGFASHAAWEAALYEYIPLAVLLLAMLLNQAGLCYFNLRLKKISFIPIVNIRGDVIGKKPLLATILRSDREAVYPVVRIALTAYRDMLYLLPRPQSCFSEKGKPDLPLEGYPFFGESIEQAARRILCRLIPDAPVRNLRYHLKYYYRSEDAHRLVYLFTLDLKDDALLPRQGKLWPLVQIGQEMGKNYFSKFLEYEYEPLKDIIYTREKYKESSINPASAPSIPSETLCGHIRPRM